MRGLITQISTDEIQNSERKKRVQIAFEHALLIGQLAHALLQLNSFNQQLRRRFITALTLFFDCCIATRQSGQQGEISFPATAERRCLRWLKPMTRHLERLKGSVGLPKKNQSSNFTARWKVESNGLVGMRCTQTKQSRFVLGTVISIGEEISRTAQ